MENMRPIGRVAIVQLQPDGLIIDAAGRTPSGYFYDPSRLVRVDSLEITPLGIEAMLPDGKRVLDIHHIEHPGKEYDEDDLVCIGFTPHYAAMREQFGEHMLDGIAGENILIEAEHEIWPDDLAPRLGIENQETGKMAVFELQSYAAPCSEFSHFCAQSPYEKLPADRLKQVLQFLGNGRRGFLLVLSGQHERVVVRPGDRVFVLEDIP